MTQPRTDNVESLIESGTAAPDIRFGLGYQLSPGQLFEHVGYVRRDLWLGAVELAGDGG